MSAGSWTNVAGVIDATGMMQVFVNGQMVDSRATSGPMVTDTAPLTIGTSDGGANLFTGLIDEVQVYHRALTTADVQSLYADTAITSAASASSPLPRTDAQLFGPGQCHRQRQRQQRRNTRKCELRSRASSAKRSASEARVPSASPTPRAWASPAAITLDAWMTPPP